MFVCGGHLQRVGILRDQSDPRAEEPEDASGGNCLGKVEAAWPES